MSSYTMSATLDRGYDDAVSAVRDALADAGFGVLTEIDVRATMKNKLDLDVPAQVILGACRPQLAHQAMDADPSISTLLPCNVVVRDLGDGTTLVETIDPATMSQLSDQPEIADVASQVSELLEGVLSALTSEPAAARRE
ncbi:MAG TPA: DUF302 domain-containing protein [Jiangellaceae bacterium]